MFNYEVENNEYENLEECVNVVYKDHQLKGNLKEFRECHVKPNLLLIYKKENNILVFTCIAVGSHSDLFKK